MISVNLMQIKILMNYTNEYPSKDFCIVFTIDAAARTIYFDVTSTKCADAVFSQLLLVR